MNELEGRSAVITGGGSGIGRGLALGLAEKGMKVVVADIELSAAQAVADEVRSSGGESEAVRCDVADFASVQALEKAATEAYGPTGVLCNNAGVLIMAKITELGPNDWSWLYSVNLMGVVHGIHAFLPGMQASGQPGHVLNTGSVSALGAGGAYGSTKAAVVAISETLHGELEGSPIGVSVLMPGCVSSRINSSQRNRDDRFGRKVPEPFKDIVDFGLDPVLAAQAGLQAVIDDELYAFVFPEGWQDQLRPGFVDRHAQMLGALNRGGM